MKYKKIQNTISQLTTISHPVSAYNQAHSCLEQTYGLGVRWSVVSHIGKASQMNKKNQEIRESHEGIGHPGANCILSVVSSRMAHHNHLQQWKIWFCSPWIQSTSKMIVVYSTTQTNKVNKNIACMRSFAVKVHDRRQP